MKTIFLLIISAIVLIWLIVEAVRALFKNDRDD